MKIIEKKYRGSLICRVLGYPITYGIVRMLLENGQMELEEIVEKTARSKGTVCNHLVKLKLANLVRYDKKGHKTIYWLKYPEKIRDFLRVCEKLVERTTRRIKQDF